MSVIYEDIYILNIKTSYGVGIYSCVLLCDYILTSIKSKQKSNFLKKVINKLNVNTELYVSCMQET